MENLTDDERELLAKARATQCWLPVDPATVVKLLEEIERLRAALSKWPDAAIPCGTCGWVPGHDPECPTIPARDQEHDGHDGHL